MVEPDSRSPAAKAADLIGRLVALAAIVTGVAFIYWPAALIVGGALWLYDRMT